MTLKPFKLVVAISLLLPPMSYVIASATRQDHEAELTKLAQQRADAAKKALVLLRDAPNGFESNSIGQEVVYSWSRSQLEAEVDLATTREARAAAYQGHLSRMQDQEKYFRRLMKTNEAPPYQVAAAELHRTEAEYWNAREAHR